MVMSTLLLQTPTQCPLDPWQTLVLCLPGECMLSTSTMLGRLNEVPGWISWHF